MERKVLTDSLSKILSTTLSSVDSLVEAYKRDLPEGEVDVVDLVSFPLSTTLSAMDAMVAVLNKMEIMVSVIEEHKNEKEAIQ